MKLRLALLIGIFIGSMLCAAPDVEEFRQANTCYQSDLFEQALTGYLGLTERGLVNFDLFYNLGNTYYRLGKLGPAIYWWKKAEMLRPEDANLRHNLRVSQKRILDEFNFHEDLIETMQDSLATVITVKTAQVLVLIFTVALFGYMAIVNLVGFRKKRLYRRTRNALIILLALTALLISWRVWFGVTHRYGVIVADSVAALSEPKPDSQVVSMIHAGLTVRIVERKPGYRSILLPGNILCWIPVDAVGEL